VPVRGASVGIGTITNESKGGVAVKILDGVSHLDHGLAPRQIAHIAQFFEARDSFFIETIELPKALGIVACNLHGPATGGIAVPEEKVKYIVRGDRKYASRVVVIPPSGHWNKIGDPQWLALDGSVPTRLVTVIAGPAGKDDGLDTEEPCVLYTAYGGPGAPREPGDSAISSWEELLKSREFWSQHALLVEAP